MYLFSWLPAAIKSVTTRDSFTTNMESSTGYMTSLQNKIDVSYKHETCEVFELAAKHGLPAKFSKVKIEGPIHKAKFTFRLTVGDYVAETEGPSKLIAKTLAAQQLLPDLRRLDLPPKKKSYWKKKRSTTVQQKEQLEFLPDENPIDCLFNLMTKCRGKPPEYTIVDVNKETTPWIFYVQVIVADQTVIGAGYSKKDAKRAASAKVLNSFGYNFFYSDPQPNTEEVPLDVQQNTPPVTQNVFTEEIIESNKPLEVTKDDACPAPQGNKSEEEIQSPAVDLLQLPVEVVQEGPAEIHQETFTFSAGDMFQLLPPDVLTMLAEMGIIQNNGTVQWCELSLQPGTEDLPSDSSEASRAAPSDKPEDGKSDKPKVNPGALSTSEPQEVLEEPEAGCKEDLIITLPAPIATQVEPENQTEKRPAVTAPDTIAEPVRSNPPAPSGGRPVSFILTQAMVKKMFKMSECSNQNDIYQMAMRLNRKIKEHLNVGDECDISFTDLQKIGKAAAKHLTKSYGPAHVLLEEAQAPDTAAFEEIVVFHLNKELTDFQNRPKSALSQILSQMRTAFSFN